MDKQQFDKLINSILKIDGKLDTLIALQKANTPKRNLSQEEKKVLNLCNGKNTVEEIASKTGKTKDNVYATLSNLRSKGLVESEKIGGSQIYSRV